MKGVRPHHDPTMEMLYLRWGQTPRTPGSLRNVQGVRPRPDTGTWTFYLRWGQTPQPPGSSRNVQRSDHHGLSLILFCFRRGRLRVLRGELCLAGLDVLLYGLLRAFVDGTALLTAEGLHQAHVVGV